MTHGQIHAKFARGELTARQAAEESMNNRREPWPLEQVLIGAIAGAIVTLAFLASGCHPSPPPVNGPPDAADAAPAPHPAKVTCQAACAHAETVCPTVEDQTCQANCGKTTGMAAKLIAAAGCPDVRAAGGANVAPPAVPGPAQGH